MNYAWIKEHRDNYSVVQLCRAMRVGKSSFYRWLKEVSRVNVANALLRFWRSTSNRTAFIYGTRKITEKLKADPALETVCRNAVARAMQVLGTKRPREKNSDCK